MYVREGEAGAELCRSGGGVDARRRPSIEK
jgi:hypothetical protein